jgi:GNAT superfamily N-acetyltransferase
MRKRWDIDQAGATAIAAQPGAVADAAARPQDRGHFGNWFRLVVFALYLAARLSARPLGSPMSEKSDARAVPVNVMMRRPTLFGVPAMPILAAPLLVRRAHVEEAGALAALLGQAFEAETWEAEGTERELFCDETVRATLVVAAEGRLVATASLQVRPDVPECGWVRWVATDLDRRREGLARALVIGVLAMAGQAGCREARLRTQTDPLAAIPLYLQLGFEPLVTGDGEREVWERVIRLLSGNGSSIGI